MEIDRDNESVYGQIIEYISDIFKAYLILIDWNT